jgi:hypothetical protein
MVSIYHDVQKRVRPEQCNTMLKRKDIGQVPDDHQGGAAAAGCRSEGIAAGRFLRRFIPLLLFLAVFFSATYAHAQITLAWDASTSPDVTGYKVHYGTVSGTYQYSVDAGNATSYTFSGLSPGATYYFAATAYDNAGGQSSVSNEVSYTVPASDPAGGGGGGGGCFIATAAFGSYASPYVRVLRAFRDACLETNSPGRAFVRWYYATSPPIADVVRKSKGTRAGVRLLLVPLIGFAYLCLAVGIGPGAFIVTLSLALVVWLGTRLLQQKQSLPHNTICHSNT